MISSPLQGEIYEVFGFHQSLCPFRLRWRRSPIGIAYLILVNTVYCTRDRQIPPGTHRNVIGTSVLRRRLAAPGKPAVRGHRRPASGPPCPVILRPCAEHTLYLRRSCRGHIDGGGQVVRSRARQAHEEKGHRQRRWHLHGVIQGLLRMDRPARIYLVHRCGKVPGSHYAHSRLSLV